LTSSLSLHDTKLWTDDDGDDDEEEDDNDDDGDDDDSKQSYRNPMLTYDDDCSIFKMAALIWEFVRRKYDGKTITYSRETEFRKVA